MAAPVSRPGQFGILDADRRGADGERLRGCLEDSGADQYTVWNTDSNGNICANLDPAVPGSSPALESLETTFHQDLNGDGVIGVPRVAATVIESTDRPALSGSATITQSGRGGHRAHRSNPGLEHYCRAESGWSLIAARRGAISASGYEVAWKLTGADQYMVWNTDSERQRYGGRGLSTSFPEVAARCSCLRPASIRTSTATE